MDDHAFKSSASPTLPASLYRDAAIFAHEQTAIFRHTWQLIGREAELAATGDFLADDIGGLPVLVVRAQDGDLRGWHNLCRHRAGPLVQESSGNCGHELTCRYHGWRYQLDGRLRAAVDFGPAEGFDPRKFGLVPIQADTWRGLVFVNLDLEAPPLAEAMAALDGVWAIRGLADLPAFAARRTHEVGCDWKTYMENFLEGYHLPSVHPGLGSEVDVQRYSIAVDQDVVVQAAASMGDARAANLGLWIWKWPNLGISLYSGGLMIERVSPIGFGRTRLDYLYFHDAASGADFDYVLHVSERTTAEDVVICEAVQKRLSGGIYERGMLSPHHEAGIAAFQAHVRRVHGPE